MSSKPSYRVSKSSPQSRSQSPNPLIEPLSSNLEADITRMVYENPNDVYNVSKNEWQMWDVSRSGSPQTVNRILTIIPNFHGIVGPCQSPCPPPPTQFENAWIEMNTGLRTNELPPMSPGWFRPPIPHEHNVLSDGRIPPPFLRPPSPPRGLPYPIPYPLHSPTMAMPAARFVGDDTQRLFQELPVEDDRRSHLIPYYPQPNLQPGPFPPPPFSQIHANFKPYPVPPVPEFGSYYLTPPPEPFTEYAFIFDSAFYPNQGQPQYPMPPPQSPPVDNNNHYHRHLFQCPPLHPNAIPGIGHQMGPFPPETSAQIPQPPPQYFYPSPSHIVISPPMPPNQPNSFPTADNHPNFSTNYNLQNTGSSANCDQNIPRSLTQHQPSTQPINPHKVQRRVRSLANTTLHGPQNNLSLSTQGGRKFRRLSLPVERSPLLEQFRSDREKSPKTWNIKDIFGHVVEFSTDQHGSRFIQSNLEAVSEEEKKTIFEEIFPESVEKLIQDVFGNYVIQKFFDFGTLSQKDAFTEVVERHVIEFSLHIYGCRVVQKAIDSISEHRQSVIIQRLEQDVLTCIKDANGNHVIQKLVQIVAPQRLTFLPLIYDNILALATHSYGCRVLQRCLEHIPEEHQENLLRAIHCHTLEFMHDQYGNYVTQFIIEHGRGWDRTITISRILGNLVRLSQHKYASNVCEKALIFSDSATRHKLIDEIMTPPNETENHIVSMIKDQYANYVLQRALIVAEGEQREALYSQVKPVIIALRTGSMSTNASRPLLSIERLVNVYFGNPQFGPEGPGINLVGCSIHPY